MSCRQNLSVSDNSMWRRTLFLYHSTWNTQIYKINIHKHTCTHGCTVHTCMCTHPPHPHPLPIKKHLTPRNLCATSIKAPASSPEPENRSISFLCTEENTDNSHSFPVPSMTGTCSVTDWISHDLLNE